MSRFIFFDLSIAFKTIQWLCCKIHSLYLEHILLFILFIYFKLREVKNMLNWNENNKKNKNELRWKMYLENSICCSNPLKLNCVLFYNYFERLWNMISRLFAFSSHFSSLCITRSTVRKVHTTRELFIRLSQTEFLQLETKQCLSMWYRFFMWVYFDEN